MDDALCLRFNKIVVLLISVGLAGTKLKKIAEGEPQTADGSNGQESATA
jgi:hypothetical protein